MQLFDILKGFFWICLLGRTDVHISGISDDSRTVEAGNVFVCICGSQTDGHQYIQEAIDKGAAAMIVSRPDVLYEYFPEKNKMHDGGVTWIQVVDTREAEAWMAAAFYHYPAEKMKMIGITGTKGKTTTSYMIKQILDDAGYKTGLIGTIEIDNGNEKIPSDRTTPSPLILQKSLAQMLENGVEAVVMEVSSQGLKHHRTDGMIFDIALLTNISSDHIGRYEHKDMHEYMECKARIFRQCRMGFVNQDCAQAVLAVQETDGIKCLYSLKNFMNNREKIPVFVCSGGERFVIKTNMPGYFNLENAAAAAVCTDALGIRPEYIASGLLHVYVRGRMEILDCFKSFTVMIDYAHNALALENLLREVRKNYQGRILCLYGCGGNRDRQRRFDMGTISGQMADLTVITNDNPRYEDPGTIIHDIEKGVCAAGGAYVVIPDRRKAIDYSIAWAETGDLIILAGKGHEAYQEIRGKKIFFDEKAYILEKYGNVIY